MTKMHGVNNVKFTFHGLRQSHRECFRAVYKTHVCSRTFDFRDSKKGRKGVVDDAYSEWCRYISISKTTQDSGMNKLRLKGYVH
jgi:hypothetical protein